MNAINIILFGIGCFVLIYLFALWKASQSIFPGSGSPINMANVLLQSIIAAGQIIVGAIVLAVMFILIDTNKISSEAGLPVIASIAGYLVGRNFNSKEIK